MALANQSIADQWCSASACGWFCGHVFDERAALAVPALSTSVFHALLDGCVGSALCDAESLVRACAGVYGKRHLSIHLQNCTFVALLVCDSRLEHEVLDSSSLALHL